MRLLVVVPYWGRGLAGEDVRQRFRGPCFRQLQWRCRSGRGRWRIRLREAWLCLCLDRGVLVGLRQDSSRDVLVVGSMSNRRVKHT